MIIVYFHNEGKPQTATVEVAACPQSAVLKQISGKLSGMETVVGKD